MAKTRAKPAQPRAKVLIVDDHPAVREALAIRIATEPDLEVCGEAADLAEALDVAAKTKPDIAVIDISLKSSSGIDLIKRFKSSRKNLRMIVLSMYSEELYAPRALRAGAKGYISKEHATGRIIDAIRKVLAGKVYLSPAMTEKLLAKHVGGPHPEVRPIDDLSDRELDVFRLIGSGVKTSDIAGKLHLSIKTVETYRDRIRQKLDIGDGSELAHHAMQWVIENG